MHSWKHSVYNLLMKTIPICCRVFRRWSVIRMKPRWNDASHRMWMTQANYKLSHQRCWAGSASVYKFMLWMEANFYHLHAAPKLIRLFAYVVCVCVQFKYLRTWQYVDFKPRCFELSYAQEPFILYAAKMHIWHQWYAHTEENIIWCMIALDRMLFASCKTHHKFEDTCGIVATYFSVPVVSNYGTSQIGFCISFIEIQPMP